MNDEPSVDAWRSFEESFECLVSSAEPLLGRIEDAFRAGYEAGRKAERETPNRLVIDTTDSQMTTFQSSAAAVAGHVGLQPR